MLLMNVPANTSSAVRVVPQEVDRDACERRKGGFRGEGGLLRANGNPTILGGKIFLSKMVHETQNSGAGEKLFNHSMLFARDSGLRYS